MTDTDSSGSERCEGCGVPLSGENHGDRCGPCASKHKRDQLRDQDPLEQADITACELERGPL